MAHGLEEYLREHPEGVSAEDAARDALRLSGPPALVARLAEQALAAVPGATAGPDGLWRIGAAPDLPVVAAIVLADGPEPSIDAVQAIGLAADGVILLSVTGPVESVDIGELGGRIAESRLVVFDSSRYLPHLGVTAKAVTKLKPVLRRAERIEASDGLGAAAAALSVVVPESNDPGDLALALDRMWRAAVARGLDPATVPKPAAPFDFDRVGFGPELLEEIPDRPGVYRFFDEDGELLYVGKAKNLRQRVGTYFGHRSKRRKKYPELMERLHTLTWEESGSELGALLDEQARIRSERPSMNVQREVRTRRKAEGDFVLFLPGETEGAVTLLLVRDGRPSGRVETDVRAKGMREVRAAIAAAFFSLEPAPVGETDDEDAQIIATWLRRERDGSNWLDVTEIGSRSEAARRVKAWLTDPDLFTHKVWHR